MQIKRFLLKNLERGIYIGDHRFVRMPDVSWYLGNNFIGLYPSLNTELEGFYKDFLRVDDSLIIRAGDYPSIEKKDDDFGFIIGEEAGIKQISALVRLISSQDETYAFLSSHDTKGVTPKLLTFSKTPPPRRLYLAGKVMPVRRI